MSRRDFVRASAIGAFGLGLVGTPMQVAHARKKKRLAAKSADADLVPVTVHDVVESSRGEFGVVLLKDESDRRLPIWIGKFEAQSIRMGIQGISTPRPMTYDFVQNVLDAAGIAPERVVITQLRDMTYYAQVVLDVDGEVHYIDSRPSDAIALSVRTQTPVFVARSVMDEAAVRPEEAEKLEPTHIV